MTTKPELPLVPKTAEDLGAAVAALITAVSDPDATLNGASDGYSKAAEAMWMAGYVAHEYVAAALGVTGFQHGYSRLKLLGMLAGYEGPYMVLDGQDALYPQYDLQGKVRDWTESKSFREWAAAQARELLAERSGAHPDVLARWEQLAAYAPSEGTAV